MKISKIKSACIALFFISQITLGRAQQAETILGPTKVNKTPEYYIEQEKLWKKEVDKNKQNANAWYNYYRSVRYQIFGVTDKSQLEVIKRRRTKIINEMEKAVPNSFEFNYAKWSNGYNDMSLINYLEKANKINPNRIETYIDLVSNSEFLCDRNKRNEYAKIWYEKGFASPGLLNYNYNVLMSLKPNAILLTCGDNDTYPVWILQGAKNIRTDVTVINTYMLTNKEYCKKICAELGIENLNLDDTDENIQKCKLSLIENLSKNKSNKPIYAALTVDSTFTINIINNIYLTGLAYEYSPSKIDNIAILKNNFENNFALDYLKNTFCIDAYEETLIACNTNYLVPIITLYEHYKLAGEFEKASKYKNLATTIAKKANMMSDIQEYFKN